MELAGRDGLAGGGIERRRVMNGKTKSSLCGLVLAVAWTLAALAWCYWPLVR